MCLAIPGRVMEKYIVDGMPMGMIDFGGVTKDVCLAYVPEIEIGRYTIVHVGFAISEVYEQSAHETLQLFREMGALEEELGLSPASSAGKTDVREDWSPLEEQP